MSPNRRQQRRLKNSDLVAGVACIAGVSPPHDRVGSDPMVRIVATQPSHAARFAM
jgi:hypothetical protein